MTEQQGTDLLAKVDELAKIAQAQGHLLGSLEMLLKVVVLALVCVLFFLAYRRYVQ